MDVKIEPGVNDAYRISFPDVNRISILMMEKLDNLIKTIKPIKGTRIIIDLSGILFIDTAGFEFLLLLMHDARKIGYKVEMTEISPEVAELITLLHLEEVLLGQARLIV